jgi:hypothetical protein
MDINLVDVSITGKKISTFARALTEIYEFTFRELILGHPVFGLSCGISVEPQLYFYFVTH